jgi:hypothetical protein
LEKLEVKPKKFKCISCGKATYNDYSVCNCGAEFSYKPINRTHYKCYLNGKFYGGGNLQYMRELFVDYVISHKMYGKSEVDFKIVKEEE